MRISGESSSAQHMWQERGAKKEKKTGFGRRPNLCLRRLWRSQPRRAAGRVAVEQISSNLSALVQGLRWEGCSPVPPPPTYPFPLEPPPPPPPPACPRLEASMPARHTGGGGWSCRMACAAQQAAALPRRKSLNGEELARDWSAPLGVSSQSVSQHVILAKNKKTRKNSETMQRMSETVNLFEGHRHVCLVK